MKQIFFRFQYFLNLFNPTFPSYTPKNKKTENFSHVFRGMEKKHCLNRSIIVATLIDSKIKICVSWILFLYFQCERQLRHILKPPGTYLWLFHIFLLFAVKPGIDFLFCRKPGRHLVQAVSLFSERPCIVNCQVQCFW